MISELLLQQSTLISGWLLYALILLFAIYRTSWVELFSDSRKQHLLFGTVFILCLLWLVRRDFPSGVSFHFIGMTAVCLLLGWPLAILAGLTAQITLVVLNKQELLALGANGLLLVALPVLIAEASARAVERLQPENLFVYIFGSGFFPAALTAIACTLAGSLLLWSNGLFEFPPWISDYIGMVFLVAFPEAFINGMVISSLVVFKPEWLETFNRSRYLQAPWKHSDDEPSS